MIDFNSLFAPFYWLPFLNWPLEFLNVILKRFNYSGQLLNYDERAHYHNTGTRCFSSVVVDTVAGRGTPYLTDTSKWEKN